MAIINFKLFHKQIMNKQLGESFLDRWMERWFSSLFSVKTDQQINTSYCFTVTFNTGLEQ